MISVNKLLNIILQCSKLHLQTYRGYLAGGKRKKKKKKKILPGMTLWITLLLCLLACQTGNLVRQVLLYIRTQMCELIKTQCNYTSMQHPLCLTHHVSYPLNVNDPSDGLRNESGVNGSDYCGCRCVICVTCNLMPKFNRDYYAVYSYQWNILKCTKHMFLNHFRQFI